MRGADETRPNGRPVRACQRAAVSRVSRNANEACLHAPASPPGSRDRARRVPRCVPPRPFYFLVPSPRPPHKRPRARTVSLNSRASQSEGAHSLADACTHTQIVAQLGPSKGWPVAQGPFGDDKLYLAAARVITAVVVVPVYGYPTVGYSACPVTTSVHQSARRHPHQVTVVVRPRLAQDVPLRAEAMYAPRAIQVLCRPPRERCRASQRAVP